MPSSQRVVTGVTHDDARGTRDAQWDVTFVLGAGGG
jgi:hypothetical protein